MSGLTFLGRNDLFIRIPKAKASVLGALRPMAASLSQSHACLI